MWVKATNHLANTILSTLSGTVPHLVDQLPASTMTHRMDDDRVPGDSWDMGNLSNEYMLMQG